VNSFIEVTSPTSTEIRWTINIAQIVMLRRKDKSDEAVVQLVTGGTIETRESYTAVQALLFAKAVA
jgi:hypothetical protein